VGDVDDSKQSGIGEGGADAPPASECHSSIAGLRPISEYRGGTATGVLEALTRGKERICALVPGLERRGSGGGAGTRAPPSRSWRPPGCAAWSSSLVPAAALRGGEGPTLVAKLPQQAVGLAEHVRFNCIQRLQLLTGRPHSSPKGRVGAQRVVRATRDLSVNPAKGGANSTEGGTSLCKAFWLEGKTEREKKKEGKHLQRTTSPATAEGLCNSFVASPACMFLCCSRLLISQCPHTGL